MKFHWRVFLIPALLALVVSYGALLRLDRLFRAYGPFDHPGWLVSLERSVGALRPLVPASWDWPKIEQPYVGGDPINYLKYSREMQHFYQGHVREPIFLATTRVYLWMTGDQDVAVSFASLTYSVLCIVVTYLLGSLVASRWVGLLAALALAIEHEVITWAPDGWRDEAFTAFVALSAWSLVRLQRCLASSDASALERKRAPWWPPAVVAGIVGALACLTRLSSLTFLLPAWLWLAWPRKWPALSAVEPRAVGLAAGVTVLLIAPYLINSWRAQGDPFLAINYHTSFYRNAEGFATDVPTSAVKYTLDKFRALPVATTDTAIRGIFVNPFEIKWRGLHHMVPPAAVILPWFGVAGLVFWLWQPAGRLLLVVLLTSLVPYMITWSLRGGDHWRFTLHTYPFYLVAAFQFLFAAGAALAAIVRGQGGEMLHRLRSRRVAGAAAAIVAVAGLALYGDRWAPYLVARESVAAGNPTTIGAGPTDGVFFGDGWSGLVVGGNVVARLSTAERSTLWVPMLAGRAYRIVLRMDPVPFEGAPPQNVRVLLGGRDVAKLLLTWNPERVGAYQIDVPADAAVGGRARLDFLSDYRLPLERAGSAFPELPRSVTASFRLWYVRLTAQ